MMQSIKDALKLILIELQKRNQPGKERETQQKSEELANLINQLDNPNLNINNDLTTVFLSLDNISFDKRDIYHEDNTNIINIMSEYENTLLLSSRDRTPI